MNASNAVIKIFTVHRGISLLPVVPHGGHANRVKDRCRDDNMSAEPLFVTKMKQIRSDSGTTAPGASGRPEKSKLANTVRTVVNGSRLVAREREKVMRARNIWKHFACKQGWAVTNIAPRLIRVNPECEVRGNLMQHWQDAACVRLVRKGANLPRIFGQAQEIVQMKTADGHRGVMGDQPVFDWQATCLPVNPLDRQEKRECPTHW